VPKIVAVGRLNADIALVSVEWTDQSTDESMVVLVHIDATMDEIGADPTNVSAVIRERAIDKALEFVERFYKATSG
jgi:hypothetical protein